MNRKHFADEWNCCSTAAAATEPTLAARNTHGRHIAWNLRGKHGMAFVKMFTTLICYGRCKFYLLTQKYTFCGGSVALPVFIICASRRLLIHVRLIRRSYVRDAAIECWCHIKRMDCVCVCVCSRVQSVHKQPCIVLIFIIYSKDCCVVVGCSSIIRAEPPNQLTVEPHHWDCSYTLHVINETPCLWKFMIFHQMIHFASMVYCRAAYVTACSVV